MIAILIEDLGDTEYITVFPSSAAAYLALKKGRGKKHIEVLRPEGWVRVA